MPLLVPEEEYREFNIPGVRLSGAYKPDKARLAQLFREIITRTDTLAKPIPITLEEFGAVADGNFGPNAHTDGTNNAAAIASAVAAAAATGRPILLTGVFRTSASSLVLTQKVTITGFGSQTGFSVVAGSTDSGIWDRAGCKLHDFHVHLSTLANKPANEGHMQACVLVSDKGYFFPSPGVDNGVYGFDHQRLTLTRNAVMGLGSGSGWFGMGHVHHGKVGEIRDEGSATKHGILVSMHWSGRGAGYGQIVTRTWHPHDMEIGSIFATASINALNVSSSYNITQRGIIDLTGGSKALYVLPGDETDTLADPIAHPPGSIGKNLRFGDVISRSPTGGERAVHVFSQGTSALGWRSMPGDPGVGFMSQLEMDVTVGDITLYDAVWDPNAVPATAPPGLLEVQYYRGKFKAGKLRTVNCPTLRNVVDLFHSQNAIIEIDDLSGITSDRALRLVNCSNVTIHNLAPTTTKNDNSGDTACYFFGATYTGNLSGAHAAGATTLLLKAPLAVRMTIDTPIKVGGQTVWTTGYCPPNVTRIPVSSLPVAVADDALVTFVHRNEKMNITFNCEGSYNGADIALTHGVFKGTIRKAKVNGVRARLASNITLESVTFEATGFGGSVTDTASDVLVSNEATRVRATGCVFGLNAGAGLDYNVRCVTAEGTWRRFVATNSSFMGARVGNITATSASNYSLIGCTNPDGSLIA